MRELTVKYGDVEFKNPIVAVAGPLGRTFESLKRSIEAGCGAVTLKSNNAKPKETIEPRPSAHILARPAHLFLNKYRLKNMMINLQCARTRALGADFDVMSSSGICANCIHGAISMQDEEPQTHLDLCMGCGVCESICPTDAIAMQVQ